jgi:hypothetical protein
MAAPPPPPEFDGVIRAIYVAPSVRYLRPFFLSTSCLVCMWNTMQYATIDRMGVLSMLLFDRLQPKKSVKTATLKKKLKRNDKLMNRKLAKRGLLSKRLTLKLNMKLIELLPLRYVIISIHPSNPSIHAFECLVCYVYIISMNVMTRNHHWHVWLHF